MEKRAAIACGCVLLLLFLCGASLVLVGAWYYYYSADEQAETPADGGWEIVPFAETDPGTAELAAAVERLAVLARLLDTKPLVAENGRQHFPRNQEEWEAWQREYANDIPDTALSTPWGTAVEYIFTHNHSSFMLNCYDTGGALAVSWLGGASHRVGPIPYQAPAMLTTPIGVATDNFIWNRTAWGSPVHNLVADALREMTGSDVAVVNFLGIRANIPQGTVSREQLAYVLPFGNTAVVVEVTGAKLTELMRISQQSVRPLTFSGVSATRQGDCFLSDGSPVLPGMTYRLALSNYLADGGRYAEFSEYSGMPRIRDSGELIADIVADYISRHSPITPDTTERLHQP